jgi:hypothetical protein
MGLIRDISVRAHAETWTISDLHVSPVPALIIGFDVFIILATLYTIVGTTKRWRAALNESRTVEIGLIFTCQILVLGMTIVAFFVSVLADGGDTACAKGLVQGTIGVVVTSEVSFSSTLCFAELNNCR